MPLSIEQAAARTTHNPHTGDWLVSLDGTTVATAPVRADADRLMRDLLSEDTRIVRGVA